MLICMIRMMQSIYVIIITVLYGGRHPTCYIHNKCIAQRVLPLTIPPPESITEAIGAYCLVFVPTNGI